MTEISVGQSDPKIVAPVTSSETVDPNSELVKPVSFDWKLAKRNLDQLIRNYVVPADSEQVYDLGHDGRGFDDFTFVHQFTEQNISLKEFFDVLADEIEKYIRKRLEVDCTLSDVQDFFEAVFSSDTFVPSDDFFSLYQSLIEKYKEDKESRQKAVRMGLRKVFKLGEYASIVWKLRHPNYQVSGQLDLIEIQKLHY